MKSTALFISNYLQAFGNLKFASLFVRANTINAIISFTYVSAPISDHTGHTSSALHFRAYSNA